MSHGAGSGDKLARGAARAQFMTTEGGISQDKWAAAFDDYNPEEFKNAPSKSSQRSEVRSSDASSDESGIPGVDLGAVESGEPVTR